MKLSLFFIPVAWGLISVVGLAGCQTKTNVPQHVQATQASPGTSATVDRIQVSAPMAWGGEAKCFEGRGCQFVVIEHEEGKVALHRFEGRSSRLLDRQPVAYHPDSAIWLSDKLVAAAIEETGTIDIYRADSGKLERLDRVPVGFSPRDVVLVTSAPGHFKLLATPYSGQEVSWIDWYPDGTKPASVKKVRWCEAPWHPAKVDKIPGAPGGGVVVACLDGRRIVAVSDTDLLATPRVIASFGAVSRHARPSPSGRWLYVALETGGRNARIDMQTAELQWIQSPLTGSVSVAPLADDLVVWGEDGKLYLQRLDAQANVLETRWLKTGGFSTGLQLVDLDGDGERDIVVLNSVDAAVDVIYGPLWEKAASRP